MYLWVFLGSWVLSYEMELLHLSTDAQCVSTQKDTMDWSIQNPIYVHDSSYIFILPSLPIFYKEVWVHSRLFPLKLVFHSPVGMYMTSEYMIALYIHRMPLYKSWVTRDLLVSIVVSSLIQKLKNKNKFSRG